MFGSAFSCSTNLAETLARSSSACGESSHGSDITKSRAASQSGANKRAAIAAFRSSGDAVPSVGAVTVDPPQG